MNRAIQRTRRTATSATLGALALGILIAMPWETVAAPISFQNGSASFSQPCAGGHSPDLSVDGDFTSGNRGWAIANTCMTPLDDTDPQTAVWETTADFTASQLSFQLHQLFGSQHLIGRFRLSVTSDDRSTFADGLDNAGDVTATWMVLTGASASGPAGMTFAVQGDDSVLVGGTVPNTGVYSVGFAGSFMDITGIRLEVLEEISLPFDGPGLQPTNGNFVLTELTLDASSPVAMPEPGTLALFGLGLAGLGFARRSKAA